jgi:hypothetical protein
MKTRHLKGGTGNLYDTKSEACHFALQELWVVLDRLGFKLEKKRRSEDTLRVYPIECRQPPLLNRRLVEDESRNLSA